MQTFRFRKDNPFLSSNIGKSSAGKCGTTNFFHCLGKFIMLLMFFKNNDITHHE